MTSKQTVLGRVAQLAKADVKAVLREAEDPHRTLDRLVRDCTDQIEEAEEALTAAVGQLRLLEKDHHEDAYAAAEWGAKALAASRRADELRGAGDAAAADRFDGLARVALGRQVQAEEEVRAAEPVIAAQSAVVERLGTGLDSMRITLTELRSLREQGAARSAPDGRPVDAVAQVDVFDPAGELARFEEKLRREEDRVKGAGELAASPLDARFEQLDRLGDEPEVAARLAALKATT